MSAVLIERPRPGIALVTLNRPERRNALTPAMVERLFAVLDDLDADGDCRVVVLTGAGRGFCAGMDLEEGAELLDAGAGAAAGEAGREYLRVAPRLRALRHPVIAAVNGPAIGAGFVLALASDIRVASESARFEDGFTRIGVSGCEMGLSWLLPRLVGLSRAAELMLTGRRIDAAEAERIGLVHRVVPDGRVVEAALELAEAIVANTAVGVRTTKEVMWAALESESLQATIEIEARAQALCLASDEVRERIAALRARRARKREER